MVIINIGHKKISSNIVKIYINKAKYSSCNNSFNFKLMIFYTIYSIANVLLRTNIKTIFTMIQSLVLDSYYLTININSILINFNKVYNFIRNDFKK